DRRFGLTIVGLALLRRSLRWRLGCGGRMTVGDARATTNHQKSFGTLNLNELSRPLIVIAQMLGDGLIMAILSFLSFSFVILHSDTAPTQYLPYIASTIGTTIIMIAISAGSKVYDVFDEFNRFEVLRSTIKCVAFVILMLTAALFIFKVS